MKYVLLAFLLLAAPMALAETRLFDEAPIIKAISADDVEAAQSVLLEDPSVTNKLFSGSPPLVIAAEKASSDMVALLLKNKADVNKADAQANTALMVAAANGNDASVAVLIKAGANLEKVNRQGMTALIMAAREGHHESVKLLLAAGADKKVADFTGRSAKDWAQESRNQATLNLLN